MRAKIEQMQHEVNEFMEYVKNELQRGLGDWEQRLNTALVKSSPTPHPASPPWMRSSGAPGSTEASGGE